MAKRLLEIVIALACLLILMPVMLIIAALISLETRENPIFSQTRVGRQGKLFQFHRFRTLTGESMKYSKTGRFAKNTALDSLPMLWNIIRGDMAIIGPKPEMTEKVDLSSPVWQKVLSVRPGAFGLGILTLREAYDDSTTEEKLAPEVYYAENHSLAFDVKIFVKSMTVWLRSGRAKGKV